MFGMKNNKQLPLLILALLLSTIPAFGQSAYIVDKDTFGSFNKEYMERLDNVLRTDDEVAFKMLIVEGKIFPVKKGTKVFFEDSAVWSGCMKVRPQGGTEGFWVFLSDLTEIKSRTNKAQKEKANEEDSIVHEIKGIIFDKTHPVAIIGDMTVSPGDIVNGAKILKILPDSMIIEQAGKTRTLKIGDYL